MLLEGNMLMGNPTLKSQTNDTLISSIPFKCPVLQTSNITEP
ncbi:hypothetical protein JCM19233_211 [Vibrio astriarenae]|nr:hypothetical protein JCM19233_211 [Vibrio sp. C7]